MEKQIVSTLVLISMEDLDFLKQTQKEILEELKGMKKSTVAGSSRLPYLTAKEFMASVKICRSKFDKLVAGGKILIVKKKRKIYVAQEYVERYFKDASIQ